MEYSKKKSNISKEMTFFTSLSPSFIKIFSSHCNINFLPLQKLNKNSILLVFAPQSIHSCQYLTITRKEDRGKAIDCNLSPLLPIHDTELGHATSNPFHNFTFYSTFLKEKQDYKNYQRKSINLSKKFTPDKTNGPMVQPNYSSINQWAKKELQSDSTSSRFTITQTLFKKDQRLTRNLDDFDISLGKRKSLSNSTSTSTLLSLKGSRRVRNAQVKSSKKVATLGRLGSVLRIPLKNRVESILNNINVLSQPDDFCTDYYHNIPNTSYSGTSMVIICSYNKLGVFSQLKVTDNEDAYFIPKRSFKRIRPLLNCSRSSITKVCKHVKIPVYPDKSNESLQYSRNRIRKQILPIIQLFFNPKVENSIYTFAEVITKEQNLLATLFNSK